MDITLIPPPSAGDNNSLLSLEYFDLPVLSCKLRFCSWCKLHMNPRDVANSIRDVGYSVRSVGNSIRDVDNSVRDVVSSISPYQFSVQYSIIDLTEEW